MRKSYPVFHFVVFVLAVVGILFAAPAVDAKKPASFSGNPIIFVHGSSGSAAQFETQGMRFTSNGYPSNYIRAVEYDSSSINSILPAVLAQIDALIAELQAETGAAQVDLMGHSLGTFVCQSYLATPARAANVAHYVNIDGAAAASPPGGVPTLALWAGAARPVQPVFGGATNVTIPNQEHVEVASSAESFFEMYSFLQGHAPATTDIVPEPPGQVRIEGRADFFPQNTGIDGATLEIWRVDGATGERIGNHPRATYAIGPDGHFGPFKAKGCKNYEFSILRDGQVSVNYFYEPFRRSDNLVRLNVADGLAPYIDSSPASVALTILRNQEFWGDRGPENDVLSINGVDVINPTTAPSGAVGVASVAFFLFDDNVDGVSNLNFVPFPFPLLGFLTAADLFIPADPPGTISVVTVPRGDVGATRTVNVPNLPSTEARVVVQLNDFKHFGAGPGGCDSDSEGD